MTPSSGFLSLIFPMVVEVGAFVVVVYNKVMDFVVELFFFFFSKFPT